MDFDTIETPVVKQPKAAKQAAQPVINPDWDAIYNNAIGRMTVALKANDTNAAKQTVANVRREFSMCENPELRSILATLVEVLEDLDTKAMNAKRATAKLKEIALAQKNLIVCPKPTNRGWQGCGGLGHVISLTDGEVATHTCTLCGGTGVLERYRQAHDILEAATPDVIAALIADVNAFA